MSTSNIILCMELYTTSAMQQCFIREYVGPMKYTGLLGTISIFILDDRIHMQGCSRHGGHHQFLGSPVLRLPAGHYLQIPGILLSLCNPMSTQHHVHTVSSAWEYLCSSFCTGAISGPHRGLTTKSFFNSLLFGASTQCPLPFPFLPLTTLSPPNGSPGHSFSFF